MSNVFLVISITNFTRVVIYIESAKVLWEKLIETKLADAIKIETVENWHNTRRQAAFTIIIVSKSNKFRYVYERNRNTRFYRLMAYDKLMEKTTTHTLDVFTTVFTRLFCRGNQHRSDLVRDKRRDYNARGNISIFINFYRNFYSAEQLFSQRHYQRKVKVKNRKFHDLHLISQFYY